MDPFKVEELKSPKLNKNFVSGHPIMITSNNNIEYYRVAAIM